MPCPVLFSDQESSGSAAKGRREHRKRTLPAGPYALHTIVLRDLYDFLDVISFAQTAKAMGTPSAARRTLSVRSREMH